MRTARCRTYVVVLAVVLEGPGQSDPVAPPLTPRPCHELRQATKMIWEERRNGVQWSQNMSVIVLELRETRLRQPVCRPRRDRSECACRVGSRRLEIRNPHPSGPLVHYSVTPGVGEKKGTEGQAREAASRRHGGAALHQTQGGRRETITRTSTTMRTAAVPTAVRCVLHSPRAATTHPSSSGTQGRRARLPFPPTDLDRRRQPSNGTSHPG